MTSIKSFEDLECWKMAAEVRRELSQLTKTFPQDERFRLVDQVLRASRSVTANIAEGYGRFHYQEYIQFCRQSRGSYYELIDHLIVSLEEKYISVDVFNAHKNRILSGIAILNGFTNYLHKAKQRDYTTRAEEPLEEYLTDNPIND